MNIPIGSPIEGGFFAGTIQLDDGTRYGREGMTTERSIQDVAMIARNGIDRVIELERENKRLTDALIKANAQAEHFEREWYLRGDEVERLRKLSDEMYSTITAAMLLTPHECGAYGVLETAIQNLQPKWIRSVEAV